MDVLTTLKRLADAKSAQTKAWNDTQGLVTTDYDILTTQVAALRRGELDGEMSVLRDLDGAEMPDTVRNQILESVKNNEQTVSSVETLSTESFYGSDIIYVKDIQATGEIISRAFANCYSLYAVLGVSFVNAKHVNDLFKNCYSLRAIKFSDGDFAKAGIVSSLFEACKSITRLTLPSGSFAVATDARSMFSGCSSLTELTLPSGSFGAVTDANNMFYGCRSLTMLTLPEGSFGAVTNARSMFYGCSSLTVLTLPEGSFGAVTSITSIFQNCSSLTSLTFSEGSLGQCETASNIFYGCTALKSVILPATFCAKSINNAFLNCSSLTSIDLHGMTRQAVQMYKLFNGCILLKSVTGLDLSGLALTVDDLLNANIGISTSGAEEAFSVVVQNLFYNCNSLSDCRLSGILYKSGVNLKLAKMLSAESLYSWVKALYDWETNEEGKTTDDEDHVLYMSASQQQTLTDYTGENGENGEDAYLEAIAKGWTILN